MEQTAVNWLVEMWDKNQRLLSPAQIIQQAKEMEKRQIIDAYKCGKVEAHFPPEKLTTGEQYYNEIFKSE